MWRGGWGGGGGCFEMGVGGEDELAEGAVGGVGYEAAGSG